MAPRSTLIVIYTPALEACRAFYASLGLELRGERHGTGPAHYAAVLGDGTVFEIYPSSPRRTTGALRLGFTVDPGLTLDGTALTPGRHLFHDPDGRTVEVRVPPA
ncbi:glyoxalase/bleomycin resistance/dioxygenase family protein [Streptosporangium sp. NPDC001559]|uniref:glyoxalase/bleomycin resistance/dioxygenase family protein n=1 Tax=Streptosporangium sp. NPDC001559 TaxID=3366187 RepID=UPI0036E00EB9